MNTRQHRCRAAAVGAALCLFAAAAYWSGAAIGGARAGVELCLRSIVPSLLPFMVLSNLLCALGLPALIGRSAGPVTRRLFGVSGPGMTAFILGLTGGYPIGAAAAADLYASGAVSRKEAERLLLFCNNTGPAFIIGMAGAGVFSSTAAGIALYLIHMLSAVLIGVLCRGRGQHDAPARPAAELPLAQAVTTAMTRAVRGCAVISGFVVFFSALTALMQESGLFTLLSGLICRRTPLGIGVSQSLVIGFLELGGGIAALTGLPPTPDTFAASAFILGWGGVSVQFQTAAVLAPAGLNSGRSAAAKLLHGLLSALLAYCCALFWF